MKVNLKNTILVWTWAKGLSVCMLLFWLLETVYFLIVDGWHWKATSNAEIVCDIIVTVISNIVVILVVVVSVNVLDFLLSPSNSEEDKK